MKVSFAVSKTFPGIRTILQVIVNSLDEILPLLQRAKVNVDPRASSWRIVLISRGQQVTGFTENYCKRGLKILNAS